jgi:hypothetical protein
VASRFRIKSAEAKRSLKDLVYFFTMNCSKDVSKEFRNNASAFFEVFEV